MQNNQTYSDIINFISTKEDFNLIKDELDLLEKGIYETKNDTFEESLKKISSSFSSLVSNLIKIDSQEIVIKRLKEELTKIKFLELTLAKDPSREILEKIIKWLVEKKYQNIALDIKIDPRIFGGAKISFEGKYLDASLKSKLDETLKNYAF